MVHDKNNICPGCNQDSNNLALSDLVKTWEPCNCSAEEFVHLVETTWHRRCFLRQLVADFLSQSEKLLSETTVMELMRWSYEQTVKPSKEYRF